MLTLQCMKVQQQTCKRMRSLVLFTDNAREVKLVSSQCMVMSSESTLAMAVETVQKALTCSDDCRPHAHHHQPGPTLLAVLLQIEMQRGNA